jgi:membrane protease subunit HflC
MDTDSGEPLVVETFARYRIDNPLKFMQTLGSKEAAQQRIESIMNDTKRSVLGGATMKQLLSPERADLMEKIRKLTNDKTTADQLGITIIDIRIVGVEQPPGLRKTTVERMISAFQWQAMQTSSNGYKRALEIRANAERQRTIILADADRDAKAVQGDADRQAIKIYADAFGRDKDFYEFWRSMEAYRTALARDGARFVLSPDDPFLKFFKQLPQEK